MTERKRVQAGALLGQSLGRRILRRTLADRRRLIRKLVVGETVAERARIPLTVMRTRRRPASETGDINE